MLKKITHPLNILNPDEIIEAVGILKSSNKDHSNSAYSYITLEEPDKNLLKESLNCERVVKIVGVDQISQGFEAKINLTTKELSPIKQVQLILCQRYF